VLIAVVSAKGSPGVSVSALAWTLTWSRPVILVECDPRGGDFVVGYAHSQAGQGRDLLAVHMATQRGAAMSTALRDQVLQLGTDRWLLAGVPEPQQAERLDWTRLGRTLSTLEIDVIADCGAVSAISAPRQVWSAADLVLLATRSTASAVRAAQLAIPRLRSDLNELGMGSDRLGVALIDAGHPYSKAEIAAALSPKGADEVPIVTELPLDVRVAGYLSSGVKVIGNKIFDGSKFASAARRSGLEILTRGVKLRESTDEVNAFGAAKAPYPANGVRSGGMS